MFRTVRFIHCTDEIELVYVTVMMKKTTWSILDTKDDLGFDLGFDLGPDLELIQLEH